MSFRKILFIATLCLSFELYAGHPSDPTNDRTVCPPEPSRQGQNNPATDQEISAICKNLNHPQHRSRQEPSPAGDNPDTPKPNRRTPLPSEPVPPRPITQ